MTKTLNSEGVCPSCPCKSPQEPDEWLAGTHCDCSCHYTMTKPQKIEGGFVTKGLFKGDVYKNKRWCPSCKQITRFTEWLDSPRGYLKGVICGKCGDNRQQKSPAIYNCFVYQKKCKCGKKHTLITQDDDSPEYMTQVGIICDCGEAVFINLPVN